MRARIALASGRPYALHRPQILEAGAALLRLQTFGALKVLRDGELAVDKEIQRKQLAVLVVLATDGESGVSRDRLMGIFWPDMNPEDARHNLDQALTRGRATFGRDIVLEGQAALQLNAALLASDVADFRQALARRDLAAAVQQYGGPFLDAFSLTKAPEFERWAEARRAALAKQCVDALLTLSRSAAESGDLAGAAVHARRAAQEDRFSSAAVIQLMTVLAWAGDRVGAIDAYRVHATLVREELESEPNGEVSALADRIRKGEIEARAGTKPVPSPPPAARAEPAPPPPSAARAEPAPAQGRPATAPAADAGPSVAVLPFRNISLDPNNTYFADGMTEAIIGALSRIKDLRVCARTTMMGFKGYAGDICELGRRLGVRTVVEGTVITEGDIVRVSASLITVEDGSNLWLGQFNRKLVDIFAVQDEIAAAIVQTLHLTLVPLTRAGAVAKLGARASVTTAAYEQYLLGRHFRDKRDPASLRRALACYRAALQIAPEYAEVFSAEADTLAAALAYGVVPPADVVPRIREAASRAMALDPTSAEPHGALGAVAAMCDRDWAIAERHFQRALDLKPHYQTGWMWYANYCLAPLGRIDEALEALQRARRLDLLSPVINTSIGMALFFARRYDDAVRRIHGALELDPGFPYANYFLGRAELMRGHLPAAIAALERTVAVSDGAGVARSALGFALARAGDEEEARAILGRLEAPSPGEFVSPFEAAFVRLGLGDDDAALAGFERAAASRTPLVIWLGVQPETDHLRGTPRFDALVRSLRVAP